MQKSSVLIGLAILLLLLTPVVPRMMQLRIAVLRKLHLRRMADFHERNRDLLVRVVRAMFLVLATLLLWLAYRSTA